MLVVDQVDNVPHLQAFSPDNSHLLLIETEGYVIRRLDDLSLVHIETASWNGPRWHGGLANTILASLLL